MSTKAKTTGGKAPRSWLITGLLASLAIAYVAFIFAPAQASIGSLRGQLNERRQHILQAQNLVLPIHHAQTQLEATREVTRAWRDSAPDATELSENFARLTAEAKAAGVVLERFDPQAPAEMQVLAQHAVNVQFHGQFAAVFDFLRRIEELPATIWISQLRIGTDGEGTATLRGELNLTIFVDRTGSSDSSVRIDR